MKIRNGYVSNSSSSSFILTYNKNNVETDPVKIVDYITKHPNEPIILRGGDVNEGEDIFYLDEDMSRAIRTFPDEFIENNKGTRSHTVWEKNDEGEYDYKLIDCPAITAYYGKDIDLVCNESWCDDKVDIIEEQCNLPQDIVKEEVEVDYNVVNYAGEFNERYLTKEYSDYYFNVKRYYTHADSRPYLIAYKDILTNKKEIIDYLDSYRDLTSHISYKDIGLIRHNDILEYNNDITPCNLDIYRIGKIEADFLLDNKEEFINSDINVKMIVGCRVYHNGEDIYSDGKSIFINVGRVADIPADGKCFYDFKKTFLPKGFEWND